MTLHYAVSFSLVDEAPSADSATEHAALPRFVNASTLPNAVAAVTGLSLVHWTLTSISLVRVIPPNPIVLEGA